MTVKTKEPAPGINPEPLPPERIDPKTVPQGSNLVRAFGVDYAHIKTPEGGDLWVTSHGLPIVPLLKPKAWHDEGWYHKKGERLRGTSAVYHVKTREVDPATGEVLAEPTGKGNTRDFVVKFSRIAQEPQFSIDPNTQQLFESVMGPINPDGARFNSPFEEFHHVMELRAGKFGPPNVRILTQKPYAIYSPPDVEEDPRMMDRQGYLFDSEVRRLREHDGSIPEEKSVKLDLGRRYIVIYEWVKGESANQTDLPEEELKRLTLKVAGDVASKGWRVLDTKPAHVILRRKREGRERTGPLVADRKGEFLYALVDHELLEHTPGARFAYEAAQRHNYLQIQKSLAKHTDVPRDVEFPPNLKPTTVEGVHYVHGPVESTSGELWVVGSDPRLFDYFRPERWLYQSRQALSPPYLIFSTVSKDSIEFVWSVSSLGEKPDPAIYWKDGAEIARFGFNSPFEQFQIAEELRSKGVNTVYPRAIYRMGSDAIYRPTTMDLSRFNACTDRTPDGRPVLIPNKSYAMIWGSWRGGDIIRDREQGPLGGCITLIDALYEGKILPPQVDDIIRTTQGNLNRFDMTGKAANPHDIALFLDEKGDLRRNSQGNLSMVISVDAQLARLRGIISVGEYDQVLRQEDERLRAAGFEDLNLIGQHILLSVTPECQVLKDERGDLIATHCNFEFFRKIK